MSTCITLEKREEIEKWFDEKTTDPLTNKQLTSPKLIPNVSLKNAILSFLQVHPMASSELYFSTRLLGQFCELFTTYSKNKALKINNLKMIKECINSDSRVVSMKLDNLQTVFHLVAKYADVELFNVL